MKAKFTPMSDTPPNASKGQYNKSSVSASKGSSITAKHGPMIAPGYMVTGQGNTTATGGPFSKAHKAKRVK